MKLNTLRHLQHIRSLLLSVTQKGLRDFASGTLKYDSSTPVTSTTTLETLVDLTSRLSPPSKYSGL